jgi:hypothetical protein
MKTKIIILAAIAALLSCAGCSSLSKLKQFEAMGITEAQITGKFSNTEYRVVTKDGKRRAEFDHSNAWMPKVHVVRETDAKDSE